jgi:hypothetical protein
MAFLKLGVSLGGLALIAAPAAAAVGAQATLEYAVKASYLYKFAPFVGWPPRAFANARAPFRICVIGEDPFGPVLDQVIRGQRVGGHPVAVLRMTLATRGMGCHILFAGGSERQSSADMLTLVQGEPVLTVTDRRDAGGSMIQFVMQGNRVRFTVDAVMAQASGLPISSKLLQLAVPNGH